ncbi:unnamed protein product [Rangifer tarandus platyrhynchus]|uniref:Uncharacterized protein n=1 Tax=Rangifer tarandus platyrhynchus TaxID=3082113 RepID=A0ABN8YJC4_RANTA|nr:unnamed protein product [Rangifer tarandus platyrhynchus]
MLDALPGSEQRCLSQAGPSGSLETLPSSPTLWSHRKTSSLGLPHFPPFPAPPDSTPFKKKSDVTFISLFINADGQGSLACCSPWGRKELDTTEQLKCTE